jgi:hypothetical protein
MHRDDRVDVVGLPSREIAIGKFDGRVQSASSGGHASDRRNETGMGQLPGR